MYGDNYISSWSLINYYRNKQPDILYFANCNYLYIYAFAYHMTCMPLLSLWQKWYRNGTNFITLFGIFNYSQTVMAFTQSKKTQCEGGILAVTRTITFIFMTIFRVCIINVLTTNRLIIMSTAFKPKRTPVRYEAGKLTFGLFCQNRNCFSALFKIISYRLYSDPK